MRSLGNHWSGGDWLPKGWHLVRITGCEFVNFTSGNRGIKFLFEGIEQKNRGKAKDTAFALVDNILWKLASFVRACGFTEEEAKAYNVDDIACHRNLINRTVGILIDDSTRNFKKDGTPYAEVTEWYTAKQHAESEKAEAQPINSAVDRSQPTTEAAQADAQAVKDETRFDDIPF